MPRHSKTTIVTPTPSTDPALHLCVIALLRVIVMSPPHGSQMSSEKLSFLESIAQPDDIVTSLGTARQQKSTGKPPRANHLDGIGSLDKDNFDLDLLRCPTESRVAPESHPFDMSDSSIRDVIKAAPSLAVQRLARTFLSRWEKASLSEHPGWLDGNVQLLQKFFGLSEVESMVARLALAFANVRGRNAVICECINDTFYCRAARNHATLQLACAIDRAPEALADIFKATAPLRSSGLLCNVSVSSYDLDDVLLLSELGQLFATEHFENEAAVRQRILCPLSLTTDHALVFTHLDPQKRDIVALLEGAIQSGASGINVLLYGQPGTGKTEFAKTLAAGLGVTCYEVGFTDLETGMDASRNDRLILLKMANRLIPPQERALILLDEAEDIFDSMGGSDGLFGKSRRRGSKAWMNDLLQTMRIPTLWITNDIEIDAAHVRRFAYIAEIGIPPTGVRRQIVRSKIAGLAVSEATIERLARNDALTPAMLGAATTFVRLAGHPDSETDAALVRHIQASQHALGVASSGIVVEGETDFDPRLVNLESSISVEDLVGALSRTGRAGLLFHGPSGTGKTQLGNYLAKQLDRDLIYRTGSDLLNKYVGGTEQRIANLFRSCDVEREIIFLDEAEGLLGNREGAHRSWEITQVNEFLRQIEQFKGIFIAATNHVANLDAALMRRFAFKLGFKPLAFGQKLEMLASLCGESAINNPCATNRLREHADLTAGDFANVARRIRAVSDTLSLEEFLAELEMEASLKKGAVPRKIGFT